MPLACLMACQLRPLRPLRTNYWSPPLTLQVPAGKAIKVGDFTINQTDPNLLGIYHPAVSGKGVGPSGHVRLVGMTGLDARA